MVNYVVSSESVLKEKFSSVFRLSFSNNLNPVFFPLLFCFPLLRLQLQPQSLSPCFLLQGLACFAFSFSDTSAVLAFLPKSSVHSYSWAFS